MALFGAQLIITMVAACILQKLGPFYSLARYLLCNTGLKRYIIPDSDNVSNAAGTLKNAGKRKSSIKRDSNKFDNITVLKNAIPEPVAILVELDEVSMFKYFTEYQWLLDFSLCTVVVYTVTEVYSSVVHVSSEVNLSLLWCVMVVGFALRVLCSLTRALLSSPAQSGSAELCLVAGLAYFVISMIVLVVRGSWLELELDTAYSSFNSSAVHFLQLHGHQSSGPASILAFRLLLAGWSGFIGAILAFPGLRFTRMYRDQLRSPELGWLSRALCHVTFLMPLLCLLMWVRPLARFYLTEVRISSLQAPLLNADCFESVRIWLVVACVLSRCLLAPTLMQAYLRMAQSRVHQLRCEAGRIRLGELRRTAASVYYYLCAAALQLLTPLILTMFLTLMYKSLGEYSWVGARYQLVSPSTLTTPTSEHLSPANWLDGESEVDDPDIAASMTRQVTVSLAALRQVFTRELLSGVLGYTVWWNCFVMCTSSLAGITLLGYI